MKRIQSFTKNESGYSLILVFFILMLVSVLSISLLSITTNSLALSKHEREDQSIFYIAEAGLNVEKQNINRVVYEAYNFTREEHKKTPIKYRDSIDFTKIFVDKIKTDLNSAFPSTFQSFETQFGKQPEAKIEVDTEDNIPLKIIITSTGYFNDKVANNRVVTQTLRVDLDLKFLTTTDGDSDEESSSVPELPQLAVQTTGDITLRGSSTINGSVATSSGSVFFKDSNKDTIGGDGNITGKVGVDTNKLYTPTYSSSKWNAIKGNVTDPNVSEIPFPVFPTDAFTALSSLQYPADLEVKKDSSITNIISKGSLLGNNWITNNYSLNITQDTKFKQFIIDENNYIYLDIGNKTVNLLVDNLNIINGNLKIIGNGNLNIFVNDSLNIKGSIHAGGNPNQVNIYYSGNNSLNFANHTNVSGSLFAQNANLNFSGGLKFSGNIITGGTKVNINGGSSTGGQYIIAPNADISLSEGGHIKGVVIGKSFEGSGGTSVTCAPSVVPPPFKPNPTPDYSDPEDLISEEDLVEI